MKHKNIIKMNNHFQTINYFYKMYKLVGIFSFQLHKNANGIDQLKVDKFSLFILNPLLTTFLFLLPFCWHIAYYSFQFTQVTHHYLLNKIYLKKTIKYWHHYVRFSDLIGK